jgi:hypothetical protein
VSSSIAGSTINVGGGAVVGGAASFTSVFSSGNISTSGSFIIGNTIYGNGSIELYGGGPVFLDFHAAGSATDFSSRIISWAQSRLEIELYDQGVVEYWQKSGGFTDWRVHALPDIGGTNLQRAGGSGQIGPAPPSSRRFKRDITTLVVDDDSPVWKLRPTHFWWDEDKIHNGAQWNEARPDGFTNFIAEEVGELIPEGVNLGEDGLIRDVNQTPVVAWLCAAVQHLRDRVIELEGAR